MDFLTNRILLCVVFSWLLAQILKLFMSPKYRKNMSVWRFIVGSGGMPSSHSAVVSATAVSCGILHGFDSAYFAIATVLAIVVMRDAAGIRREAGKQAEAINAVTAELSKKRKNFADYTLAELLGHTPFQVVVGALLGILMAFLCQNALFPMMFD